MTSIGQTNLIQRSKYQSFNGFNDLHMFHAHYFFLQKKNEVLESHCLLSRLFGPQQWKQGIMAAPLSVPKIIQTLGGSTLGMCTPIGVLKLFLFMVQMVLCTISWCNSM